MSSTKLIPPVTEEMTHATALRAAAEYCKAKGLAEYRFSSASIVGALLYNLEHPEYSKMLTTDKKIHCASGVLNIWVAANNGSVRKKVA